jgi:hypothetical protein
MKLGFTKILSPTTRRLSSNQTISPTAEKLVYVIENHDMVLEAKVLQKAIPKIEQESDTKESDLSIRATGRRTLLNITTDTMCPQLRTLLPTRKCANKLPPVYRRG